MKKHEKKLANYLKMEIVAIFFILKVHTDTTFYGSKKFRYEQFCDFIEDISSNPFTNVLEKRQL